jgi:hypothetical protein
MFKATWFGLGALLGLVVHLVQDDKLTTLEKQVREELGEKFTVEKHMDLFVVASDDAKSLNRGEGTLERVYKAMYRDFMKTKPVEPLRVYLFKDKDSYEAYNQKAYGHAASTPYGFFMPSERKMVMNISTGLGTLAHELVHPLNEADFPGIPSWFNEGFASLLEQSYYTDDGSIRGDVNWRLPNLQKGIKAGTAPTLKSVMQTTSSEFYGESRGLNYATARYLCYYLQQKELLVRYYQSFREHANDDPTGVATLEKILEKKLDDFEPDFQTFISGLKHR